MRPTRRLERNPLGEWVPVSNSQTEATVNVQSPSTTDTQIEVSADKQTTAYGRTMTRRDAGKHQSADRHREAQTQISSFVTLRHWTIEPTIGRTRFCLWVLLLVVKFLSILMTISFWLSSLFFLRALVSWDGFYRIMRGIARRRAAARLEDIAPGPGAAGAANAQGGAGGANHKDPTFWTDVFPPEVSYASYQIYLAMTESPMQTARVFFRFRWPLLLSNPVVWLVLIIILFISQRLLYFLHDCLQNASQAMEVTSFHQNLAKKRACRPQNY